MWSPNPLLKFVISQKALLFFVVRIIGVLMKLFICFAVLYDWSLVENTLRSTYIIDFSLRCGVLLALFTYFVLHFAWDMLRICTRENLNLMLYIAMELFHLVDSPTTLDDIERVPGWPLLAAFAHEDLTDDGKSCWNAQWVWWRWQDLWIPVGIYFHALQEKFH